MRHTLGTSTFIWLSLYTALIAVIFGCNQVNRETTIDPVKATSMASSSEQTPKVSEDVVQPSISDLVENVQESVVSISVNIVSKGLFQNYSDEGSGTGIIIKSDGFIVTNYHVIQNASDIEVVLWDGTSYSAELVGSDVLTDLAIVKIGAVDLPPIEFGNSQKLRPGDWVFTIGNALALKGGPSVTLGIVSGLGRTIKTERGDLYDMIQTDAAINKGNSGGPLLNLNGEVVGINTAVYRSAQGIGFAVSSSVSQSVLNGLMKDGRVIRPLIGLSGVEITPMLSNRYNLGVSEGIYITN
ncbi:trypsin-like peptidase domain-containing protein, partial [Dehalococcoidia bacterium]|nr:trypsin-like peptidase domain-containing protein [Dehalococcoidia bacterium]